MILPTTMFPPAFTPGERATVEAFFGKTNRGKMSPASATVPTVTPQGRPGYPARRSASD
ncbi:MAG: hypothetical protein WD036_05665 [Bauldia sp.]